MNHPPVLAVGVDLALAANPRDPTDLGGNVEDVECDEVNREGASAPVDAKPGRRDNTEEVIGVRFETTAA